MLYLRNILFYLCAAAFSLPFLVLVPLAYLPLPKRWVWAFVTAYLKGTLFLLKWIIGLDYMVRNPDRLNNGPVVFAAAHHSTWENLFFQILLPNPAILIKEEIFNYPVAGVVARRNGHIPAHRGGEPDKVRSSFLEARRQAARGRSVLVYPSGTRTGTRIDPPHRRGVAALYGFLDLPCVPIAHNSGLFWPNDSWLRRPGTIIVDVLEPIPPGLDKQTFLSLLKSRLNGAADILLQSPDAAGEDFAPRKETASVR